PPGHDPALAPRHRPPPPARRVRARQDGPGDQPEHQGPGLPAGPREPRMGVLSSPPRQSRSCGKTSAPWASTGPAAMALRYPASAVVISCRVCPGPESRLSLRRMAGCAAAPAPLPPSSALGAAAAGISLSHTATSLFNKHHGHAHPACHRGTEACDVPVRWSCRTGMCHTCATAIMSGAFSYAPEPVDDPTTAARSSAARSHATTSSSACDHLARPERVRKRSTGNNGGTCTLHNAQHVLGETKVHRPLAAECSIAISLTEPEVQSAVTSAHARPRPPTVGGRLAARQSTLGLENSYHKG